MLRCSGEYRGDNSGVAVDGTFERGRSSRKEQRRNREPKMEGEPSNPQNDSLYRRGILFCWCNVASQQRRVSLDRREDYSSSLLPLSGISPLAFPFFLRHPKPPQRGYGFRHLGDLHLLHPFRPAGSLSALGMDVLCEMLSRGVPASAYENRSVRGSLFGFLHC